MLDLQFDISFKKYFMCSWFLLFILLLLNRFTQSNHRQRFILVIAFQLVSAVDSYVVVISSACCRLVRKIIYIGCSLRLQLWLS